MRICIVGLSHTQLSRLSIHFPYESFIVLFLCVLLIYIYVIWVLQIFPIYQYSSTPYCYGQACIISRRQHQTIVQVFEGVQVSRLYFGGCPSDIGFELANFDDFLLGLQLEFLAYIYGYQTCHNFGQGGHLGTVLTVEGGMNFKGRVKGCVLILFIYDVGLCTYLWRGNIGFSIVFKYLFPKQDFGLVLQFSVIVNVLVGSL